MGRVSFPRQVGRLCTLILLVHGSMTGSLALFSRLTTDTALQQHWNYSTPVLRRRRNYFRFWESSFYLPALTKDEQECLEAWVDVMGLDAPPLVSRTWSPNIVTQDSLGLLDGLAELRDSVEALRHCVNAVTPYVTEIRREHQGPVTFLHFRMKLDVSFRVPFTSYTVEAFTLPSTVTLQLQRPSYSPNKLHICAAEHRWWGGKILSHQTDSVRSVWGDVGDLCRRYNGFMISTMTTKQASIKERVETVRARARKVDQAVQKQQEEQVAAIARGE